MKKILVATEKPFAAIAVNGIKEVVGLAGLELALLEKYTSREQLLQAVADCDAMIIRSDQIDDEVFAAAPNLKIVVRAGAGYDNVDLEAATRRGIVVMNTPGQNANAVAELVLGLLVFGYRNFYDGSSGKELQGKKLGLLAFGNVGRNVARIARGFGMEICAYDPFCPSDVMEAVGVQPVSGQEDLFATCDIVSLHIPATPETVKSIHYDLIMKMKPGAVLINTARKEVVDEEGLLRAMNERHDLKYLTDVKPAAHNAFTEQCTGRYFATPKKMGAQTSEANTNAGIAAARQIVAFFQDGCTRFQVNK